MTYSIVARDGETGQLGVAVQTCMFAVGSVVPWVRAGVGAVASQAIAESAYGPRCLDALVEGGTAATALDAAVAADPMSALRQVGVVAADGSVAATTGELCIDHAGHQLGDGFAVQANMMASPEVWPAMAEAFTAASGPLARRLLASLAAGETAGGDARGRMSAALVVVEGVVPAALAGGTVVDLRVDRSEDPIGDLTRLLVAADSYAGFGRAVDQLFGGDPAAALTTVDDALALLPGEENLRFLRPSRSLRPAPPRTGSPSSDHWWRSSRGGASSCGASPPRGWSRCPRAWTSTPCSAELPLTARWAGTPLPTCRRGHMLHA